MENPKRLVLIDGHAIIHRAYHAFPNTLMTSKGEMTNAVYGFTSILFSTIKDLRPTHMAVAFDKKGPTFRHRKYTEYKATRQAPDKEMVMQIPRIRQVVEALNLPVFEQRGFEADDIIGSLAKQASEKNINNTNQKPNKTNKLTNYPTNKLETIIVTGDQDALQLVNEKVKVYMPARGRFVPAKLFDIKGVLLKYGIKPEQIVDYKALVGDSSDNIPGVAGIGPKTAKELLNKLGTLSNIYHRLDEVSEKTREILKKEKETAFLSQDLATIYTQAPVTLDLACCQLGNYDKQKAVKLFEELEFKSLIKRLPEDGWEEMVRETMIGRKGDRSVGLKNNSPSHKTSSFAKATKDEPKVKQMELF